MEMWELVVRERVRETVADYTFFGDSGRVAEMAGTFAEDGVLEVKGDVPLAGRAAIAGMLADAVARGSAGGGFVRHLVTNLRFAEVTPRRVRATAAFLVLTARGPDHWGRYRDEFVPVGDRWLLARREVRVDAAAPDSTLVRR